MTSSSPVLPGKKFSASRVNNLPVEGSSSVQSNKESNELFDSESKYAKKKLLQIF